MIIKLFWFKLKLNWWIMNKVLVIGIGGQGLKYIEYFKKNWICIFGVCKTQTTKEKIEKKYWIDVSLNYDILEKNKFDLVIVSLPLGIQWEVVEELALKYVDTDFFVEIPVTNNKITLKKLTKMNNVSYFIEEKNTLLAKVLEKNPKIKIDITVTLNKVDLTDYNAMLVCYTHLLNNFLMSDLNMELKDINFKFHDKEDVYYEIKLWKESKYVFDEKPRLIIGEKIYLDNYNFDNNLKTLLELNQKELKKKFLENYSQINHFLCNWSDF